MIIGLCFDFYRITRWKVGFNKFFTFIGDLFFSLIALLIIYYLAQKANFLEWRFYLFAGSLLGLIIYLCFFSRFFKKLFKNIYNLIFKLFNLIGKMFYMTGKGIALFLTALMSIPYQILRWFGLLLFRIGEQLSRETILKVKGIITRNPKI